MKIIFIEPINVLSSKHYRKELLKINGGHNYNNFLEHEFEPKLVNNLTNIVNKTQAKIVLYTKSRCCSTKMADMLRKLRRSGFDTLHNWQGTISSNTSITKNQALTNYISKQNNIERYVVIDNQLNCDTKMSTKNIFWVEDEGLDEKISKEIIQFLGESSTCI